jgi:hypothetical protein
MKKYFSQLKRNSHTVYRELRKKNDNLCRGFVFRHNVMMALLETELTMSFEHLFVLVIVTTENNEII